MMKSIMNPRAAAVAFAASALVATPALADPGNGHKHSAHPSAAIEFDVGNGLSVTLANGSYWSHHNRSYGHRSYRDNRYYGYNDRNRTKKLRGDAIRACKRAVKYESERLGFRRAYLDDVERVKQIGPRGFSVRAEFEFEGRRRDFERDVTCTVRRGRVVDIHNMPRPRRHRNNQYGYGYGDRNGYGYSNDDYGYRHNDYLKGGQRKAKKYDDD